MKRDKKMKDASFDSPSILDTNSARLTTDFAEEELKDKSASRKQTIISVVIVLCVLVALALVFVLGGIVSNYQYEKKQKEEAEASRLAALKDPREDTIYITGDEPELLAHRVTWNAVSAYYSNENGMYITMNFANGHATAVPVTEISVWLKRGDELVASGRVRNIVDLIIPASGDVDYTFYLDPSLVKITDLKENIDLVWELEVTTDVDEESQALAKEKREDTVTIVGEKPQIVTDEVTYAVTEAYYTKENGMCVTVVFTNGKETAISMKEVAVKLYSIVPDQEEKLLVASSELSLTQATTIPAGGTVTYTHYVDPDDVEITALAEEDQLEWVIAYTAE